MAILFQPSLIFASNARTCLRGAPFKCLPYIRHVALLKYYTRLKRLCRDKHSSLFGLFVSDREKSFIPLSSGDNVPNLFSLSLMNRPNRLECVSLTSLSSWVYYLQTSIGPVPRMEYLSVLLYGRLPTLYSHWKGLSEPNSLAYMAYSSVTKNKCFVILSRVLNGIKPFSLSLMKRPNKLEVLYLSRLSSRV
jgi:hypothetical protein